MNDLQTGHWIVTALTSFLSTAWACEIVQEIEELPTVTASAMTDQRNRDDQFLLSSKKWSQDFIKLFILFKWTCFWHEFGQSKAMHFCTEYSRFENLRHEFDHFYVYFFNNFRILAEITHYSAHLQLCSVMFALFNLKKKLSCITPYLHDRKVNDALREICSLKSFYFIIMVTNHSNEFELKLLNESIERRMKMKITRQFA